MTTQHNRFWNWLVRNSSKIETLLNSKQFDAVEKLISGELDSVAPEVSWEIGLANNQVELTISAEGSKILGKILDEMFASCPSIPKWKIYRYKQPKSLSRISNLLASQGYKIKLDKINVQVTLNRSNSKVDVVLISSEFVHIQSENLYDISLFVLDGILGEKIVEEWIGSIKASVAGNNRAVIHLSDLQKFVNELVE